MKKLLNAIPLAIAFFLFYQSIQKISPSNELLAELARVSPVQPCPRWHAGRMRKQHG